MFINKIICMGLKRCFVIQLAVIMTVSVSFYGCGRKALPLPPRQTPVPAVKDLSLKIEADTAVLTWTVPDKPEDKNAGIKGFVVHRAKQKISEGDCRNCPVKFKPVAEIPAETKTSLKKIEYTEQLEKGFKYVFKVTITSNAGAEGGDSNHVEIIY